MPATITDERHIQARPEVVAKAIASPHGLGTWLCDQAQVDRKPSGRLLFSWNDGRLAVGRWTEYDPPTRLAWHVADADGGDASDVAFELRPAGDGTRVAVTHAGVPDDKVDRQARSWRHALDDLQVFCESGRNNRLLRRPMMGVNIDLVSPESAKAHGLAVDHGILVTGTLPGSGAELAGLRKGDVLVDIDGHELSGWESIGVALEDRSAGDVVHARLYRGIESLQLPVTLRGRPVPQAPEGREAIASALHAAVTDWAARLQAALAGVTDEQADKAPAEGEWNVKKVLAHLSLGERFGHDWLCRLASDSRPPTWPEDPSECWQDTVAALPIDALVARVVADLRDTEALSAAVLAQEPPPWVERQVAESIQFTGEHLDEHLAQIRAALGG